MTQGPEQKPPTEVPPENKRLTPEEFNQLANLGLGKVYFLPVTEKVAMDSSNPNDPLTRIENALGNNNKKLEFLVSPDPALIILPVDKKGESYIIISRNGERAALKIATDNTSYKKAFNRLFNPDFPSEYNNDDVFKIIKAIKNNQNILPYLKHLADSLECQLIDPSRSEEEFIAFKSIFDQSLETAKSLKEERQARQRRVNDTFDPKLRSLIND